MASVYESLRKPLTSQSLCKALERLPRTPGVGSYTLQDQAGCPWQVGWLLFLQPGPSHSPCPEANRLFSFRHTFERETHPSDSHSDSNSTNVIQMLTYTEHWTHPALRERVLKQTFRHQEHFRANHRYSSTCLGGSLSEGPHTLRV